MPSPSPLPSLPLRPPFACRPGTAFLALSFLLLWGCDRTAPEAGEGWQVHGDPIFLVSVGAVEERGEARGPGFVTWATRMPDGGVVVADHHGPGIHRFSPQGELLHSVSRPGGGPGEMRSARWVSACGSDELLLWDYTRRVFLFFDHDLVYLGEARPQEEPDEIRCLAPLSAGETEDEERARPRLLVLGFPHVFPPQGDSGERGTADLWISDFRGRRVASLGVVPHHENRALARRTRLSTAQGAYFLGLSEDATIRRHPAQQDAAAAAVEMLRVEEVRRPPTPEEYEAAVQARADFMASERGREVQYERMSAIPAPRTVPPYHELAAAPDGTLWVVTSTHASPETRLEALDPEGNRAAQVTLPFRFDLMEAGEDWLLGVRPGPAGSLEVLVLEVAR